MANRYVYSGATGTASGADWTNAYTTLAAGAAAAVAGDVVLVAHDHAETAAPGAGVTLTFAGSAATATYALCVDRTSGLPATTATYTHSTNFGLTILCSGTTPTLVMYGINFAVPTGQNITVGSTQFAGINHRYFLERLTFQCGTMFYGMGTATLGRFSLMNCGHKFYTTSGNIDFSFGGQLFEANNDNSIQPFFIAGTAAVTTPFATPLPAQFRMQGVDFTPCSSTATINLSARAGSTYFDCKIGASQTVASAIAEGALDMFDGDSALTGSPTARRRFGVYGTLISDLVRVRAGGATDGTTSFSWKAVSKSTADPVRPFELPEGAIWNDVTGSAKTLTVELLTDAVTLTNRDVWLEVDYLGTSGSPLCKTASTRLNLAERVVATPTNLPTSAQSWVTTSITTPVKQYLQVSFTPQNKGPLRWRVCLGKASTTVYVDPKATVA